MVGEILSGLRANKVYRNIETSLWFRENREFLGYKLSTHGKQLADSKVQDIAKLSPPTKVKEPPGFLQLANFLRPFTQGYSEITRPLTDLLKSIINGGGNSNTNRLSGS